MNARTRKTRAKARRKKCKGRRAAEVLRLGLDSAERLGEYVPSLWTSAETWDLTVEVDVEEPNTVKIGIDVLEETE